MRHRLSRLKQPGRVSQDALRNLRNYRVALGQFVEIIIASPPGDSVGQAGLCDMVAPGRLPGRLESRRFDDFALMADVLSAAHRGFPRLSVASGDPNPRFHPSFRRRLGRMTAFADLFTEHREARRQLRRASTVRGSGPATPAFRRAAARYAKSAAELVDEWHPVAPPAAASVCQIGVTTRSVQNRTLSRKPSKFSEFHKRSFLNRFRLSGKS